MLIAVNNGSGSMASLTALSLGGGVNGARRHTMVGDCLTMVPKIDRSDNLCNELGELAANMASVYAVPKGSRSR